MTTIVTCASDNACQPSHADLDPVQLARWLDDGGPDYDPDADSHPRLSYVRPLSRAATRGTALQPVEDDA